MSTTAAGHTLPSSTLCTAAYAPPPAATSTICYSVGCEPLHDQRRSDSNRSSRQVKTENTAKNLVSGNYNLNNQRVHTSRIMWRTNAGAITHGYNVIICHKQKLTLRNRPKLCNAAATATPAAAGLASGACAKHTSEKPTLRNAQSRTCG
jgi:hypothetical protein